MAPAAYDTPPGEGWADAVEEGRCGYRDGLSRVRHVATGRAPGTTGARLAGRRDRPIRTRQPTHTDGHVRDRLHAIQPYDRSHGAAVLPESQTRLPYNTIDRRAPDSRHRKGALMSAR